MIVVRPYTPPKKSHIISNRKLEVDSRQAKTRAQHHKAMAEVPSH
jgi:hypothetical protein